MNGIKDEAAQAHIAYRAQPKNYSAGDAYLMLSRLDPKKWKNHLLKPLLRAKAVRRKGVQYRDYDEAISAAVGLNAIGDKEAKAAVAYWLGGEKGGYYNSEGGFMSSRSESPTTRPSTRWSDSQLKR